MGTQFVVQLDNRPGSFAGLTRALAEKGINLRAISGGGTGACAYTVLETDDDDATRAIDELDGHELGGRKLTVNEARERSGGGGRPSGRRSY